MLWNFGATFYHARLYWQHLQYLVVLAFPAPMMISCPSNPTPLYAGLWTLFYVLFFFIYGIAYMGYTVLDPIWGQYGTRTGPGEFGAGAT